MKYFIRINCNYDLTENFRECDYLTFRDYLLRYQEKHSWLQSPVGDHTIWFCEPDSDNVLAYITNWGC